MCVYNAHVQNHTHKHALKQACTHTNTRTHPPTSQSNNSLTTNPTIHSHKHTHTQTHTYTALHRRSYIINCICTFVYHALEKRKKYIKDIRENNARLNTVIVQFNNKN